MTTHLPLACANLWQAVMDRADARCQCTGSCGQTHAKSGGRCPLVHGTYVRHGQHGGLTRLFVAPADPASLLLPDRKTATLPRSALAAWCPACHHHAFTTARATRTNSATADQPDTLF